MTPQMPKAGQKMEIVINRKGKEVRVFLNEGDTVSDLKRSIAAAIGTTPDKVKISPKNHMLSKVDDASTLAETREELRQVQERLTESATKIQAHFRGSQVRKEVGDMKRAKRRIKAAGLLKIAVLGLAAAGAAIAAKGLPKKEKKAEVPIPKGFFAKLARCQKGDLGPTSACMRDFKTRESALKQTAKAAK